MANLFWVSNFATRWIPPILSVTKHRRMTQRIADENWAYGWFLNFFLWSITRENNILNLKRSVRGIHMDGGYLVYLEQLVEVSFGDFVWRYSGGISPIRAGKGSRLALPPHLSTPVHHHYGNAASQVPLFHPYLPSFFSQLHRNALILHRPYMLSLDPWILPSLSWHVVAKSSEFQHCKVLWWFLFKQLSCHYLVEI